MDVPSTKTIVEIIGGIVGGIVGLISIYKFIWPKVKRWIMTFVGYDKISAQLEEVNSKITKHFKDEEEKTRLVTKQLSDIVKEIHPNGGTSMRDALNRIECTQLMAEQRHKALISDLEYGTWETNSEGDVVWVNRTLCRITGRTPPEILGHGWVNMIATEDRERVHKEWDESIKDKREFEMEYKYATPDGGRVRVLARTVKMISASGKILGFIGLVKKLDDQTQEIDLPRRRRNN